MDNPRGPIYRIRRMAWFTVIGVLVWPVGLLMALLYPEERKYWLGVFGASLIFAVIVFVYLATKKGMLG